MQLLEWYVLNIILQNYKFLRPVAELHEIDARRQKCIRGLFFAELLEYVGRNDFYVIIIKKAVLRQPL